VAGQRRLAVHAPALRAAPRLRQGTPASLANHVAMNPSVTGDRRRAATAREIPVAHTPAGGYGDTFPAPVLSRCTEPLVPGAPDLRGVWRVTEVEVNGITDPDHPVNGHLQRIEQCGDRLVVTAAGVIHDMRCDGTEANGVHDVAEFDKATPIVVIASYEDGVHVLRPVGLDIEVTRRRDGDDMVWQYLGFTARLTRQGEAPSRPR